MIPWRVGRFAIALVTDCARHSCSSRDVARNWYPKYAATPITKTRRTARTVTAAELHFSSVPDAAGVGQTDVATTAGVVWFVAALVAVDAVVAVAASMAMVAFFPVAVVDVVAVVVVDVVVGVVVVVVVAVVVVDVIVEAVVVVVAVSTVVVVGGAHSIASPLLHELYVLNKDDVTRQSFVQRSFRQQLEHSPLKSPKANVPTAHVAPLHSIANLLSFTFLCVPV